MIQADEDGKGQVKAELDLGPYGKEKDMLEDRGGKEQGPIIKTEEQAGAELSQAQHSLSLLRTSLTNLNQPQVTSTNLIEPQGEPS